MSSRESERGERTEGSRVGRAASIAKNKSKTAKAATIAGCPQITQMTRIHRKGQTTEAQRTQSQVSSQPRRHEEHKGAEPAVTRLPGVERRQRRRSDDRRLPVKSPTVPDASIRLGRTFPRPTRRARRSRRGRACSSAGVRDPAQSEKVREARPALSESAGRWEWVQLRAFASEAAPAPSGPRPPGGRDLAGRSSFLDSLCVSAPLRLCVVLRWICVICVICGQTPGGRLCASVSLWFAGCAASTPLRSSRDRAAGTQN